jgi:hypothetical protein
MDGSVEPAETHLSLTVEGDVLDSSCLLTGSGFKVCFPSACKIRELLCGQLGIDAGYLRARIQTIFLTGHLRRRCIRLHGRNDAPWPASFALQLQ